MTTEPLWLQAPAMQEVLHALVNRLDLAERNGTKAQSVALTERNWPALYKAQFESAKEELWEQMVEMAKWGWIAVKPDSAFRSSSGYAASPRITVTDQLQLRRAAGRLERAKSSVEKWREAVSTGLSCTESVKQVVGEFCIDLADHSMAEVVERLNLLVTFADRQMLLREVSAQLFWGMSKVLDKRQGLVAAILGIDECPFPESPIQLQVFLPPAGYKGVLFIENQASFEQALRSNSKKLDGLALVFASGFKGSALRLRSPSGCTVFYAGVGSLEADFRDAFEAWLFGSRSMPAYFWGDLDYDGIRILAAMRASFPGLTAWEPGYAPMLSALLAGKGHSPEAADKQGQRPIAVVGCAFASEKLLPAMKELGQFVDQELFSC